jgi:hypothetical protein
MACQKRYYRTRTQSCYMREIWLRATIILLTLKQTLGGQKFEDDGELKNVIIM